MKIKKKLQNFIRVSTPIMRQDKNDAGFTIIELMVSLTIFIVVIGSGTDIFLSFYKSERDVQQLQDVLDNARLALERMTKTIRVSRVETANTSMTGTGTNSLNVYHFRRQESLTYRMKNDNVIEQSAAGDFSLTGEKIDVEDLRFYIQNVGKEGSEYLEQPLVTIVLKIKPKLENLRGETISLQTSVSQRCLEDRENCHFP